MEEDIKVLEELCNNFRFEQRQILTDGDYTEFIDIEHIQAIENLIKGYKELEICLKAEEKYSEGLNNDIKSLLNIEPNTNFIHKDKIKEILEDIDNSQPVIAELKLRKLVEGDK